MSLTLKGIVTVAAAPTYASARACCVQVLRVLELRRQCCRSRELLPRAPRAV